MRRVVCWFRGHDVEPVKPKWPMVVPGSGVLMAYEPAQDGEYSACRRCRKVFPKSDPPVEADTRRTEEE